MHRTMASSPRPAPNIRPGVEDVRRAAPSTGAASVSHPATMISAEAKRVLLGRLGTEIASKVLRGGSPSRSRGRRRRRRRRRPDDDASGAIPMGGKRAREGEGQSSAAAVVAIAEGEGWGKPAAAARCEAESVVRSRFVVGEFPRMRK